MKYLILLISIYSSLYGCASNQATPADISIEDPYLVLAPRAYELYPVQDRMNVISTRWVAGMRCDIGTLEGVPVVAALIGTGKANSVGSTAILIHEFKPAAVIVTGTAGGLSDDAPVLGVVVSERVAQSDMGTQHPDQFQPWAPRDPSDESRLPLYMACDEQLVSAFQQARDGSQEGIYSNVHLGTVVSGDTFLASKYHRDQIRRAFLADAIDMESAAVGLLCHRLSVPFITVRCVTDIGDEGSLGKYAMNQEKAANRSVDVLIPMLIQYHRHAASETVLP